METHQLEQRLRLLEAEVRARLDALEDLAVEENPYPQYTGSFYMLVPLLLSPKDEVAWDNPYQPSFRQFFLGNRGSMVEVDLTGFSKVRFIVCKGFAPGASGAKLRLLYTFDDPGTVLADDCEDVGLSAVELPIDGGAGYLETGWMDMAQGAKTVVFLGAFGEDGDDVAQPAFHSVFAQFRR